MSVEDRWIYVTCVGTTPEAVYSPLWALIEEGLTVDLVHLLHTEGTRRHAEALRDAIRILANLDEGSVRISEVEEVNIEETVKQAKSIVEEYRSHGFKVIVDITPGRKPMSISMFQAAMQGEAELITYLHLLNREFEREPYPLIPMWLVRLVKFKDQVKAASKQPTRAPVVLGYDEVRYQEVYPYINELCRSTGRSQVTIEVPYLGFKLLSLDFKDNGVKVMHVADKKYFQEYLSTRGVEGLSLYKPPKSPYSLFKDALIAGGALKLDVKPLIDAIRREVEEKELRGPRLVALALDTNMIYARLVTNHLSELLGRGLKVLLSDEVHDEIQRQYLNKSRLTSDWREELKSIREAAKALSKLKELGDLVPNQGTPYKARLAYHAELELAQVKGYIERIPKTEGQGDLAIMESYKKHSENVGATLIVATGDNSFAEALRNRGFTAYYVDQSIDVKKENVEITYRNLPKLILSLATYFIAIRITSANTSITVRSTWEDKKPPQWTEGILQVKAPPQIQQKAKQQIDKANKIKETLTSKIKTNI